MTNVRHLPRPDDRASRIAANVRRAMREQDVTGVQMARALHMAQSTWSRRETGTTPLTVDELALVAETLGREPGWFFDPGHPLYTGPASGARSSTDRASDYGSVVRYINPRVAPLSPTLLAQTGGAA